MKPSPGRFVTYIEGEHEFVALIVGVPTPNAESFERRLDVNIVFWADFGASFRKLNVPFCEYEKPETGSWRWPLKGLE